MLKLLVYAVLFYAAYKLFFPARIEPPKDETPPDEYVDYEEVD